MKKAKVNYEGMIKQIDTLMPDDMKEHSKRTFTLCKDACECYLLTVKMSYGV